MPKKQIEQKFDFSRSFQVQLIGKTYNYMRSYRLYHRIHIRWDFIEFGQVGHQYLFGSDAGRVGGDLCLDWCMLYYQSS